ncbi:MAG: DUF84 family protein [Rickettsiales bacterium]
MKIILASKSKIKVNSLEKALNFNGIEVEVEKLGAESGVNEQPEEYEETLLGAINRIANTKKIIANADLYIAIESGIFFENQQYFDKALIVCDAMGKINIPVFESANISFPTEAVDLARSYGFSQKTVGQAMVKLNIISNDKDPHLELLGTSREYYLTLALDSMIKFLCNEGFFEHCIYNNNIDYLKTSCAGDSEIIYVEVQ